MAEPGLALHDVARLEVNLKDTTLGVYWRCMFRLRCRPRNRRQPSAQRHFRSGTGCDYTMMISKG